MRLVVLVIALGLFGCSAQSAKKHYILAEKLWGEAKYAESVSEFNKAVAKDQGGKLGQQALYRAAMTQTLFLGEHTQAIQKLQSYISQTEDQETLWQAQLQIGDILFAQLKKYEESLRHYRSLIRQKPDAKEAPEIQFRIGKCLLHLLKFDDAIVVYDEIIQKYPKSEWAERAMFEIGETYFISAEDDESATGKAVGAAFKQAMKSYDTFLSKHPESSLIPQAKFGIAACLEEMDQLEASQKKFEELLSSYPSPNVVKIRLARIKERVEKKQR